MDKVFKVQSIETAKGVRRFWENLKKPHTARYSSFGVGELYIIIDPYWAKCISKPNKYCRMENIKGFFTKKFWGFKELEPEEVRFLELLGVLGK